MAFSDGVFAIAISLLIPDIHQLLEQLLELWPKLFAYLLSFFVVAVFFWVKHHAAFRAVKGYDSRLGLVEHAAVAGSKNHARDP